MTPAGQDGRELVTDDMVGRALVERGKSLDAAAADYAGHDGVPSGSNFAAMRAALSAVALDIAAEARADGIEEGRGDMEHLERKWRAEERRELLSEISVMEAKHREACASWERRLAQARAEERERIAARVLAQSCCASPSLCGAICQDSEESDAIARGAMPIAALIRTWSGSGRAPADEG